ncbi:MAG: vWA domain-containing protein [Pirellulales bacterium]
MVHQLALFAQTSTTTAFELGRIQSYTDWILPVVVLLVMGWFVIGMYLLDCIELGGRRAVFLITLRLLAVAGLLAIYLQPQYRTKREVVRNSRVLVLADTSQSMERRDGEGTLSAGSPSRIEQVVKTFGESRFIEELREKHDVVVYRFDQHEKPITLASYARVAPTDPELLNREPDQATQAAINAARDALMMIGISLLITACGAGWFLLRSSASSPIPSLVVGAVGLVMLAIFVARFVDQPNKPDVLEIVGAKQDLQQSDAAVEAEDGETTEPEAIEIDWTESLVASGAETKLGQAIYEVIHDERATPVAGVLVLSDGGQNAGLRADTAIAEAIDAGVPVYTVGIGSLEQPISVRLSDYTAPVRAYPGDNFSITGFVQAQGMAGKPVGVSLQQIPLESLSEPGEVAGELLDLKTINLGPDGEDVAVDFEVPGIEVPGEYAYELSVESAAGDEDKEDNRQRFRVDVVDRKTRVLLVSGGPSREYRFLRNQLQRDKGVVVDVFLQSALDNVSQDADKILDDFPLTKDELYEYDCIVAFDPNWNTLNDQQVGLLEQWVAEEAGGMIVVPGPVFAGMRINSWAQESRLAGQEKIDKLRALYPVEFYEQRAAPALDQRDTSVPSKLDFTREGQTAEFLWLGNTQDESELAWRLFDGVYGTYPISAAKPGAVVYANAANVEAENPVYMAGHFYGSGRVFYLGSSEMWRLRAVNPDHFDAFYTKLVRHVSQGRLLRGSRRGDVLLVEKSRYGLGDSVPIVAHLKNAQRDPFRGGSVSLFAVGPDRRSQPIELKADETRPGMFTGQLVVRREGDYELLLPLPESDETLSKSLKVAASALESQQPQLREDLLRRIATETGGQYYFGVGSALGASGEPAVMTQLQDRTEITPVEGDTNPLWDAFWAKWMLLGIATLLCAEWLTRRLFKLA